MIGGRNSGGPARGIGASVLDVNPLQPAEAGIQVSQANTMSSILLSSFFFDFSDADQLAFVVKSAPFSQINP
jgi:hypothetical protein